MSEHADIALDQLRLADSCAGGQRGTWADEQRVFLAGAVVHALLEVADRLEALKPPTVVQMSPASLSEEFVDILRKFPDLPD